MKAKVEIEKVSGNGSLVRINAECDTVQEVEEITRACRGFCPRAKFFGVF